MKSIKFYSLLILNFATLLISCSSDINVYKYTSYKQEVEHLRQNLISTINPLFLHFDDQTEARTFTSFKVKNIQASNFTIPESYETQFKGNMDEKSIFIIKIDEPFKFYLKADYQKKALGLLNFRGSISTPIYVKSLTTKITFKNSLENYPTIKHDIKLYINKEKFDIKADGVITTFANVGNWFVELFDQSLHDIIENALTKKINEAMYSSTLNNYLNFFKVRNFYFSNMNHPVKLQFYSVSFFLNQNDGYSIGFNAHIGQSKNITASEVSHEFKPTSGNIQYALTQGFFDEVFDFAFKDVSYTDINYKINLYTLGSEDNAGFSISYLNENYFNNSLAGYDTKQYNVYSNLNVVNVKNFTIQKNGKFEAVLETKMTAYIYNYTDIHVEIISSDVSYNMHGLAKYNTELSSLVFQVGSMDIVNINNLNVGEIIKNIHSDNNLSTLKQLISSISNLYQDFTIFSTDIVEEGKCKIKDTIVISEFGKSFTLAYNMKSKENKLK